MQLYIVHETRGVRGRLRVRASRAFSQRKGAQLYAALCGIAGIDDVRVNPRSGSILFWYTCSQARTAALRGLAVQAGHGRAASGAGTASSLELPCSSAAVSGPVGGGVLHRMRERVRRGRETCVGAGVGRLLRTVFLRPFLPPFLRVILLCRSAMPYLGMGARALGRGRLDVDVLDAAAITVSLLQRDFRTARLLVILLGVGEVLETWTRQKSRESLAQSLACNIDTVWVRHEGVEIRKALQDVQNGDVVLARAGGAIAVDGVVVDGEAVVNQASMTGEPLGVVRAQGASVYAGTVVEEGEIAIRVTGKGDDTRLQKIIAFIEQSQSLKAQVESRALRLANVAVPMTFGLAGLVWLFTRDVRRAASVLLVDYSCALRLATPLAILAALREGARHGVLIKGGTHLETLARADTVVFDKTGTLTNAKPVVAAVVPASGYTRTHILRLAACLEEHFPHPVARAVVRQAEAENLSHREEHSSVEYVVAHGIASLWRGKRVLLGSRHYIHHDEHVDVAAMRPHIERLTAEGKSLLYLAIGGKLAGLIAIEDQLRPEAPQVLRALREAGITRCIMLTGDDERTAAAVAGRLGMDAYRAQVLPVDKAEVVRELQAQGRTVLMLGDGMNDAPALSAADVGVSLQDGADLAREVADVVLVNGDLGGLVTARLLAQRALQRIHTNFAVNMGLNSLFLGAGLLGLLQPGAAALLHNSTTVGVTCNAMRPLLGAGKK